MRRKLILFVFIFIIYIISFCFFGKDRTIVAVIKNQEFITKTDSIKIHLIDINKKVNVEKKIRKILVDKKIKIVEIIYEKDFKNETNELNYIVSQEKHTPFISFVSDGFYKKSKPRIINYYGSIYIWSFFKWVRIYNNTENLSV